MVWLIVAMSLTSGFLLLTDCSGQAKFNRGAHKTIRPPQLLMVLCNRQPCFGPHTEAGLFGFTKELCLSALWTVWIFRQSYGARTAVKAVVKEQFPVERTSCTGDNFNGFHSHHRTNNARQCADHAYSGASFRLWWFVRYEASVAG